MEIRFAACVLVPMLLSLGGSADARGKKGARAGGQDILMPELQKIIGDNYEVPVELSDKAQPGALLMIKDGRYTPLLSSCVAGTPTEFATPTVTMSESLSAGVSVAKGGWGASFEGASSTQLGFIDPHVLGFELLAFSPSQSCVEQMRAYAEQRPSEPLCEVFLIQESLMAKIKGCTTEQTAAGVRVPLAGGAKAAMSSVCEQYSDKAVALGVRAVRIRSLPAFSFLNKVSCQCSRSNAEMCRPGCVELSSSKKHGTEFKYGHSVESQQGPGLKGPGSGCGKGK